MGEQLLQLLEEKRTGLAITLGEIGVTVKDISASVGFNIHYPANGSVSWTSPAISKKSAATYRAYAVDTKATYKIRKMKGV